MVTPYVGCDLVNPRFKYPCSLEDALFHDQPSTSALHLNFLCQCIQSRALGRITQPLVTIVT
jgi:hypothetical protein